jgi:hypothetical protein
MYDVEAQLLTRDSTNVNCESGMVLFAGDDLVSVRHMVDKVEHVYEIFAVEMNIMYGEWYIMWFEVYNGAVKAFVDSTQVYASTDSYVVGTYCEPPSGRKIRNRPI